MSKRKDLDLLQDINESISRIVQYIQDLLMGPI